MPGLEIPHLWVDDSKQTLNLEKLKPWAESIDSSLEDMDALIAALDSRVGALETHDAEDLAQWQTIMEAGGYFTGLGGMNASNRYALSKPSQVPVGGGQTTHPSVIYLNPADYVRTGKTAKLRLCVQELTNATNPNILAFFGLSQITASAGAAGVSTLTYAGSVVSGSTAGFNLNAANQMQHSESNDFNLPSAGFYAITEIASATQAANSYVAVTAQLQVRYV